MSTKIKTPDGWKDVAGSPLPPTQYTTEEQWTGKYWVDGKKIYRKSWAVTASSFVDFNHNITSLGDVIKIDGCFLMPSVNWWLNFTGCDTDDGRIYSCRVVVGGTQILFTPRRFTAIARYTLTVYYTKTTD